MPELAKMSNHFPLPKVTRSSQNVFTSYEIPQRTYSVIVYPIKSSNGSNVLLFGHENGVKILWRGGRQFKSQPQTPKLHKVNGSENTVVLLDSDDEAAPITACKDEVEFTDEEEEYEPTHPYPDILQNLDLDFETGVLHLNVLSSSILKCEQWSSKKIIVFIAACADNSLQLVTIPLNPPSPSSKAQSVPHGVFSSANLGNGKWGERVFCLNGHNKASNSVSITIDSCGDEPHYIIASHSYELNGRLLLWRTSVKHPSSNLDPFQSIYLASPARSISFNPSPSRPKYLLVAESMGVCRIYDYNISSSPDSDPDVLSSVQGCWLLSLTTDFLDIGTKSQAIGSNTGFGRKTIADAKWILDGCAILVLLINGEWGIWDIEGSSMNSTHGLLSYQEIKGGSKSEFNLTGFIHSSAKVSSSGPGQMNVSKFAPLTPGSRKTIEPFSSQSLRYLEGELSVIEIPSFSSTRRIDEAVLFRLGETFAVIPNITKYWALHSSGKHSGSLFSDESDSQIIKLQEFDLQGEHCSAATLIPRIISGSGVDHKIQEDSAVPEVVVLAEHRFVILSWIIDMAPSLTGKISHSQKFANDIEVSESEEMDVTNIELALGQMGERNGGMTRKRNVFFSPSPLQP